ncbi:MAG: sensor histidine kinase [Thermomicrobiales bacterium]
MLPIRWRLTIFYAVTIMVIAGLLFASFTIAAIMSVRSNVEDPTRNRAREAALMIESGVILDDQAIAHLSTDGVFLIVRDGDGRVLAQTSTVAGELAGADTDIWRQALESGESTGGGVGFMSVNDERDAYLYAVPANPPGSPTQVVVAGKSHEDVPDTLFYLSLATVGAGGVVGFLAIVGSYFLARTAFAPVNAIVRAARAITDGDLSQRLPVKRPRDELGRLATTFNDLLARLEVAFRQRDETLAQQRRFAADASHELRTPLTSIQGYARMLRQWGLDDPATARESVEAIEREAARMTELVESLLRLARGDEGAPLDPAPHDLGDVAAAAVEATRAAGGGKVGVLYQPPLAPVVATFDRDRVRQATGILLDNAVKYTPEGGTVTVAVRANGQAVELAVADNGVGIAAEHLPHIFDRFYRIDEARATGGAGLGLAIARQIAEQHGGTIEVASEVGRGSTFMLKIPVDPNHPRSGATGPAWNEPV